MTILLNNVDTDQDSDAFISKGGPYTVGVRASEYGGATVDIQVALPGDDLERFATLASGTFTADGTVKIDYLPPGYKLIAHLTGTTGPTDGVYVELTQ